MEQRQGLLTMEQTINLQKRHLETIQKGSEFDLTIPEVCESHAQFVKRIGDNYMSREFRGFDVDDYNRKLLTFMLYYFNNCKLAENVFEGEDYKIHKNIMLIGEPGTGKTIIMQIFSDYLRLTRNPNFYHNLSVTQMMNYYKINGHIDRFTYNENGKNSLEGNPFHVCLNDIGLETEKQKSYGTTLETVIDEFLFARYEIYQQTFMKYHMTSNLTVDEFQKRFDDRLVDRFKGFNVIAMTGESRRK
ncbi:ATP-binding protein [Dysgonomonas sp. 511]|uniref:ATP-binding protein n=1 Tax=Dysgonomonas sp. 511 TaxID=2302930 RepID=UPI0021039A07|nr:ATP-binding protein [Dysgonomonas sp. 511]